MASLTVNPSKFILKNMIHFEKYYITDLTKAAIDLDRILNSELKSDETFVMASILKHIEARRKSYQYMSDRLNLNIATLKTEMKKIDNKLNRKLEVGEVFNEVDFQKLTLEFGEVKRQLETKDQEILALKQEIWKKTCHLNEIQEKIKHLQKQRK